MTCVICSGVVIDPLKTLKEIDGLLTQGVAIAWLCRGGRAGHEVCSLRGRRAEKLARLAELPEPRRGCAQWW